MLSASDIPKLHLGPNVHHKISRVRWAPLASLRSKRLLFAIASESSLEPSLTLWSYSLPDRLFETEQDTMVRDYASNQPTFSPLATTATSSHVTEFQFVGDGSLLAAATHEGSIDIYTIAANTTGKELSLNHKVKFHPHKSETSRSFTCSQSACTSLSAFKSMQTSDVEIASVGSDGSIVISSIQGQTTRTIPNVDTVPMTCIRWKGTHEVLVSSTSGRTAIFDVRDKSIGMSFTNLENRPTTCAAVHPFASHQLATGTDMGDIYLWDIRNPSMPQSEHIQAHSSIVWEVLFNPKSPQEIWSCSEDGSLGAIFTQRDSAPVEHSDALWLGASQHASRQMSVLSLNSFDIHPEKGILLTGGDNARLFYHTV